MKKTDISFQEKLNELRLDISHPNSNGINFVLVEGESDIRLFRKFFNLDKCKVENIPGGNPKLEQCVDELVNIYPLIIGIRDSDFLRLDKMVYTKKNMFLTDHHDMEMTIFNNERVVNAVIFEYSNIPKKNHLDLRGKVLESFSLVSCLKWLNFKENIELEFSSGFHDLISFANNSIDFDSYVTRVLSKSPNAKITSKEKLIEATRNLKKLNPDFMQLTNGHDFMNIFAKYFREEEGRKGTSGESLETSIRMLYDVPAFSETNLYQSLNSWQTANETSLF